MELECSGQNVWVLSSNKTNKNGSDVNVVTTTETQNLENSQALSFGLLNVLVNW